MEKKALVVTARGGFVKGFLLHDIELLQRLGYEVHVCANDNGMGYIENLLKEKGAAFHQIDFASKNPLNRDNMKAAKQLNAVIRETRPQLVHCHTAIAGAVTRMVCATKKVKLIYTTHGFNFHALSSKKSWAVFNTVEKFCSIFTDTIITINQEDFKNARKMFCRDVRYIHGVGVDLKRYDMTTINRDEYREKLGISKNELFVLSIGELSPRKNHQVIIKAIAEAGLDNIVYGIAGGGVPGTSTYDKLNELAQKNNVKLLLFGFRNDVPELCHCADIGAIPSTQEGLGLAGIEQLRSGVPVLGACVQGIKDYIIDGKNGFLYKPYDVSGFAEGIRKLSNPELRSSMREACIRSAEPFDKSVSFMEMESIYVEIDKNCNKK